MPFVKQRVSASSWSFAWAPAISCHPEVSMQLALQLHTELHALDAFSMKKLTSLPYAIYTCFTFILAKWREVLQVSVNFQ